MAEPVSFRLEEFNPRRAQRGAEAARVEVTYDDGSTDSLWMSRSDIGRNMMAFGRCPELSKAHAAYEQHRYGAQVLRAFDNLNHADNQQRAERRAEVERNARENL